jgi:acetyltransferase-like isoleucine patch superfamily enzyme
MKKFIKKNLPPIFMLLKITNKFFRKFKIIANYLFLKYILGVKSVGKNINVSKGFKIFNGAHNIIIGNNVFLTDVLLNADDNHGTITIEDFVFFSHKVMVIARGHDYSKIDKERQEAVVEAPILIKKGAWIGSGAIILSGITIGKNAVVAAGSIVTKNVEDNTIVAGIPAKLIKNIE